MKQILLGSVVAATAVFAWRFLFLSVSPLPDAETASAIMVLGFLHGLFAMILMALLLRLAVEALPNYSDRLVFVTLAGLIVAYWGRIPDAIWLSVPLPGQVWSAVFDFSSWLVAGLVLAAFVMPRQGAATG